jgi:hypothetical protein
MITIKLDDKDRERYLRAAKKVKAKVETFGKDEMQRRCAVDYFQLVVKNIFSMNSPRPAYVPRYRTWKYEYGWNGYPSPWRLGGDLVKSLSAFKSKKGWVGGVPENAMDSGGKSWFGKGSKGGSGKSKPITMYGSVMEYGGSWPKAGNHPARPVFGPTAEEYAADGWLKRGDEALQEIGKEWS